MIIRLMEKVVQVKSLKDKSNDFFFWKSRPDIEKLAAIELLRQQYIKYKHPNAQPRFQRVCRVIKQK